MHSEDRVGNLGVRLWSPEMVGGGRHGKPVTVNKMCRVTGREEWGQHLASLGGT